MGKKGQTKDKKAKGHHRSNHKVRATASAIDPMVELSRLQLLTPLEYEVERQAVAKKLGIRVTTLDDLLKERKTGEATDQGKMVIATDVEPWPEPVEGHLLLDAISTALRDHLIITAEQADAMALWSVYTHAFEVFRIAPRMGFQAPGMGCGKSPTSSLVRKVSIVGPWMKCGNTRNGMPLERRRASRSPFCSTPASGVLT